MVIKIGTVDPAAFGDLLYFFYTGSTRKNSLDESLIDAAKSYHVETLELVGRESEDPRNYIRTRSLKPSSSLANFHLITR